MNRKAAIKLIETTLKVSDIIVGLDEVGFEAEPLGHIIDDYNNVLFLMVGIQHPINDDEFNEVVLGKGEFWDVGESPEEILDYIIMRSLSLKK